MPPLIYSTVLITKDRPVQAQRMLDQVTAQSFPPVRMLIVDASTPPLVLDEKRVALAREVGIDILLLHESPSMPAQRNRGIDLVKTPVTLILDDDVILSREYMERLLASWEARGLEALGGAVGARRPGPQDPPGPDVAERVIRRLFFLHDMVPQGMGTTLRRSGKFRKVPIPAKDVLVPVFENGAVAFRTDLLRKHRFDEQFTGYVYGEDLDLSGRLARDAPILHTPTTWYIHDWAPEGRANDQMWYRRSRHEAYFRLRLIDRSPRTMAAFGLSVAAELAGATREAARSRSLGSVRAYLRGLRETVKAVRSERCSAAESGKGTSSV